MNKIKQWWLGGAVALGLAAIAGVGAVMAQTPSSTPTTQAGAVATATPGTSTVPGAGTFKSNEDPTHEAGETAEQEADEDAGRGHHGGGGAFTPNEDPTHEAGETAEQEAAEDAGQRPSRGHMQQSAPNGSSTTPSGTN